MTWALVITYCWLTHGQIACERSVRNMGDITTCAHALIRALHVDAGANLAFIPRCIQGKPA